MELRNCTICGRVFNYVGRNICPACIQKEDSEYEQVREYLYRSPNASISEVSKETGVDEDLILKFLRDGRLVVSDVGSSGLECESCGRPIRSGRFCQRCTDDLARSVKRMTAPKAGPPDQSPNRAGDRMYIADMVNARRPREK